MKATDEPASSATTGQNKKTVTFHLPKLSPDTAFATSFSEIVGPLLDSAAPYSGMGLDEFKMLQPIICSNWTQSFDPIPSSIADMPFWQYGSGNHSSEARPILGSVMITAQSDQGNDVNIRHLIIKGTSQWVIGRNVTKCCNIIHIGENILQLPCVSNSNPDTISLHDHDMHCYIPYSSFSRVSKTTLYLKIRLFFVLQLSLIVPLIRCRGRKRVSWWIKCTSMCVVTLRSQISKFCSNAMEFGMILSKITFPV